MMQRLVFERPPIFDEARALFGPRIDRAIFSWGDRLYNPARIVIPPALLAHEAVHGERQSKADIECWWRAYLDSASFRLQEEIPAHQAEYRALIESGNRHQRRTALKVVAGRLGGPLYGRLVTLARAAALVAA